MGFVCKRCKLESQFVTKRELICKSCSDDLELLEEQQKVNVTRIKKLQEHKKEVEPKIISPLTSSSSRPSTLSSHDGTDSSSPSFSAGFEG